MSQYFVGIDLGSSFVKVSLFDAEQGKEVAFSSGPGQEMAISSVQTGWAEQDPELWWQTVQVGIQSVLTSSGINPQEIASFGVSAQMHGLVALDQDGAVVRPSIIWCDGRAVSTGAAALAEIGPSWCFDHLLNAPGNFTASKLLWVKHNEPALYERIHRVLLPSDYIVFKLTGEFSTTANSLSEAILWDFIESKPAVNVLDKWDVAPTLLAELVPAVGFQGTISVSVARLFGIQPTAKITYRCGDQPNNAFSLNCTAEGHVAVAAGTSAVLYALTSEHSADKHGRVNTFLHPTLDLEEPLQGVLACLNGGGKWHSWLKTIMGGASQPCTYERMDDLARSVSHGSDNLKVYPFGNGPERLLNNQDTGARVSGLHFNKHHAGHLVRAGMEGIAFSLGLGFEVLNEVGSPTSEMRAGLNNMFLSPVFRHIFVNTSNAPLSLYHTNGAEGAARGAALGAGYYSSQKEALEKLNPIRTVEPDRAAADEYAEHFGKWKANLMTTHL